jgi:long-chain acyl-CoA synthetase
MNLKLLLEETVSKYPDKTFLVMGDQRLTYAEVNKAANKVANALIKMGMRKGDRVVMLTPNRPEFVTVFFGIARTGATAIPMDIRYKLEEMVNLFANCMPKVVIGESDCIAPVVTSLSRFPHIKHVIDLDGKFQGQHLTYREIMANSPATPVQVKIDPDDIGLISYSGGPTNRPKGAVISHRCLVAEAEISARGFAQTERDVVMLFALPLYHNFALASAFLGSVKAGSTIVMVPGTGVSIATLMEVIERERGTMLFGVPYIYALANNIAEREGVKSDLSSLRVCASGGAVLRVEVIHDFMKYYGIRLADIWGLTESVSHVTCPPMDGSGKIGSIGKVLPGWEVRIFDDDGRELPLNEVGEIVVRGPVMKGYNNNPQDTAKALQDGWLHTGDLGSIDADGYVFFHGVKKEMMVLKGQNVYPHDIEETLLTHPKVAEAKVIGIPDKLRGEVVGAAIKPKSGVTVTEAEIKRFCQEHMTDYKVPRQIVFVGSIPRAVSWKEVRARLLPLFAASTPLEIRR